MSSSEIWRLLFVLFLGQLVSFFLAASSFASSYIAALGIDTPVTQSFFTYFTLALVYGSILLYRQQKLLVSWYWYLVLATIDVQGNYLFVKAYQYSSITSVTLLDCWSIPWVMILTWLLLKAQYSLGQFWGVVICILGLALVLLSDSKASEGGGKNPLWGDALTIAATFCFAFSNVGEEFCVKKKDLTEVLAMLGVFGALASACEIYIIEKKALELVDWSPKVIFLFVGFVAASFLFYSVVPFVLKMSGSTLFNLSLLTSDMWAVVIRIFIYHQKVDWLYYLAFAVVAIGLIIYSVNERSSTTETAEGYEKITIKHESLAKENIANNTIEVMEED